MRVLHWFRSDLRISDNTALIAASKNAKQLFAVFIITPKTWSYHSMAPAKIQFILNNLQSLSQKLERLGIPLLIKTTDSFKDCPILLEQLCLELNIQALYFNKQYELDEQNRDKICTEHLEKNNILVSSFDDQLVLSPGLVLSKANQALKVFTPFKKNWIQKAIYSNAWMPNTSKIKNFPLEKKSDPVPKSIPGFTSMIDTALWPASEKVALKQLNVFCSEKIISYKNDRDYPNLEGTSKLSPYLTQGILSPRQCISTALDAFNLDSLEKMEIYPGLETWISELIWREFYKHIAFHYPKVCRGKPFREETDHLPWGKDSNFFIAWHQGKTGFPFVDAAMRQLNSTGWMHNRLRMLTANFFTKLLFLDWRLGECYFMKNLIDGDFAANNGGWQWSASTGTDAAPYFRIFNPLLQSERFDPDGNFIRQYCPELKQLDNHAIHDPHNRNPQLAKKSGYPKPIINIKMNRMIFLNAFKNKDR